MLPTIFLSCLPGSEFINALALCRQAFLSCLPGSES